jgi:glyoxylase-like metal-dependent hydrolase (beta-lactamase superfamily II)
MKLFDNIYVLDSSKGSYVYLIKGEENMLIDTGLPFKRKSIINELKSICIELTDIKHILITHHDIDHIGNVFALQQLTGARVWASKDDIPYINGDKDRSSFKKYLKYIFKLKIPENINPYIPGESINGVEIVPTPGHTPGHVCLLFQDVLFAGDLLENKDGKLRPYPSAWNWNNDAMAESVKKAAGLSFQLICPAHGAPIEGSQFKNSWNKPVHSVV